jgi:ferredoxin--NADP+ reductase
MMKVVAETTLPFGVKTVASLNPIMLCGMGMCGGCRVKVAGEVKFACVDGPDFDANQVDFRELLARLSQYKAEEEQAMVLFQQRVAT